MGKLTAIDSLRHDVDGFSRFILDLQQRAATSQSSTGTAEYITPGSLDTNINAGGPSDSGLFDDPIGGR